MADLVVGTQGFQGLGIVRRGGIGPRCDGSLTQGLARVRDHQLGVHVHLHPQPVAGRTSAEGVVEGKQARLDLINGEARYRTGELGRIGLAHPVVGVLHDQKAVGQPQGGFHAFGQPGCHVGADYQAVHHHFNVVLEFLVEGRGGVDLIQGSIHLNPLEALFLQLGQFLAVLALAPAHHGGEHIKPGSFAHAEDAIHHLADRLSLNG